MGHLFSHMGRSSGEPSVFQKAKRLFETPGRALYDLLPHEETGLGLRPQDDPSVATLRKAVRTPGTSERAVQAALRTPGTIEMSTGDPGLFSITGIRNMLANRKGAAIAGTTSPTSRGSQVGLYPQQAEMIDADLPSNIAPHELIHAIRVNKKLNTRSDNVEESLARVGAGQPMTSWVNRQFDTSSPAMQAQDLGRLQQMLAETYGEQQ